MISLENNKLNRLAAAQGITASFADVGTDPVMSLGGVKELAVYVDLDRNTATDITFQLVGLTSKDNHASNFFQIPVTTFSTVVTLIDPEQVQINTDVDQKIIIPLSPNQAIIWGKLQVKASTSTDAVLLTVDVLPVR